MYYNSVVKRNTIVTFLLIAIALVSFVAIQKYGGLIAQISSDTRIPFAPYGLQLTITNYNQVTFIWVNDSANPASLITVKEYKIYRRPTYASVWTLIGTSTGTSYTDYNLVPGSYDYKVDACNTVGCSNASNYVSISFVKDTVLPTKPANFIISSADVTDKQAKLTWSASTDNIGIKYYNIYRSITSAENMKLVASSSGTTYTDSALAPVTNYYYEIKAVDLARNESPASNLQSIITKTLTTTSGFIRVVSPNGGECFTLPGNLHVTWTGVNFNRANGYYNNAKIFSGRDTTADWYMTASVSETTSGLVKVVAVDDNGVEGISDTNDQPFVISKDCSSQKTVTNSVPATPTFFRANLVNERRDIILTWQDNSKNETEFRVFRKMLPSGSWKLLSKVGPDITTYTDTEVLPGDYEYDANACNAIGCSPYSISYKITAIATAPSATTIRIYSAQEIKTGDMVSAINSSDPDVYITNEHGYKRLFLNPVIFSFYGHLGGFQNVKSVDASTRNSYISSGLFKNCETNLAGQADGKIYALEVKGEDSGVLHLINIADETIAKEDPNFSKKVFCINNNEFNWYQKGTDYKALKDIPKYTR